MEKLLLFNRSSIQILLTNAWNKLTYSSFLKDWISKDYPDFVFLYNQNFERASQYVVGASWIKSNLSVLEYIVCASSKRQVCAEESKSWSLDGLLWTINRQRLATQKAYFYFLAFSEIPNFGSCLLSVLRPVCVSLPSPPLILKGSSVLRSRPDQVNYFGNTRGKKGLGIKINQLKDKAE